MKEKVIRTIKSIAIIVAAVFVTFMINMNLDPNIEINYSFAGNSVIYVIVFIMMYWLLKKVTAIRNKRLTICCLLLAIAFASFEVIGSSINNYLDLSGVVANKMALLKSVLKWFGYVILFYSVLANIFHILDKQNFKEGVWKWFTANKRTFFITWGIIFLAWIPYFLNYFPGIITPDSMNQIGQSLGAYGLTNHHPILHTFIISIAMNIGKMIGNYNVGIAIYSIIQMLVTSAIFSFAIYYMAKRKVDVRVRILTLIFYAFYPVNGLYSMTMWKDIFFAGSMLIFTIMMTEIAINREHFMKSKLKNVLLAISILLIILFRNNGLYVFILTLPFIFFFAKQNYKKLVVITVIVLAVYGIWKGPVFSMLQIQEGSVREALSIPLQQMARIVKNHSDTLTEEEKNQIHKYLPVENLGEVYYPKISDQVKSNFNDKAFSEDKVGFVKLWVQLCLKYPRAAVESFLCNSFGYWYPESIHWVVGREISGNQLEEETKWDIKSTPIANLEGLEKYDSLLDRRDLPLNSMIYSIGFVFWVVCIMFMYAIYKKKYSYMLIYIPIIILWLTCLASPVYGEFRYIYAMFTCAPILIGVNLKNQKEDKRLANRK